MERKLATKPSYLKEEIITEISKADKEKFSWDQINTALTMAGHSPKAILNISQHLKDVKKRRLTVTNRI